VQSAAFVVRREGWQIVGGLKMEGFGQTDVHSIRILLQRAAVSQSG
jgi:hypothetical protein